MSNPFNITKAVDYTDIELNNLWVDFPRTGFNEIIKPKSEMPMIILGSKGSGKTHIMKHFSFTMQRIRLEKNLKKGIKEEGYLGTYLRCSGLNGYKFNGRGESQETWQIYFSYFLELWLGQLILKNIDDFLKTIEYNYQEQQVAQSIIELFDSVSNKPNINKITDVIKYLSTLQKNIDYAINNITFSNKSIAESIEVLLSSGSLIFGIPEVFAKRVDIFKEMKFLYLIDEFENFTGNQQRYFNTLIRERRNPTCFKIGARRYGIKTTETLSANEEIKNGSEYEEFDIDNIFRKNLSNYKEFIKKICLKRLESKKISIDENCFEDYFENADLISLEQKIIKENKRGHFKKFVRSISKYNGNKEIIKKNIKFRKSPFLERVNILLLYRNWKRTSDLEKISKEIKSSCQEYYNNPKIQNKHSITIEKYKNDIIDALYRENNLPINSYIGFHNLARISNGIPRHFLIIMKHLYRWNEFYDEGFFLNNERKLTSTSQLNAIHDTTNWFIEDARIAGKDGLKLKDVIERLCSYLRELRFSDTPPECSISTFSINSKVIPKEISVLLDYLEQYSYIIKIKKGRRDKNYNSRNSTFQINGLLASEWELALNRRGIINFNLAEIRAIFLPQNEDEYIRMRNINLKKYNTPFTETYLPPTLF